MKIGPKRNLACENAEGEIIVHFDSDDWSAPSRIRDQVERLLASGKAVSGYHSMLFWDGTEGFKFKGSADYSLGTALCYRKSFWQKHPFVSEDHKRWEDNVFVQDARNDNEIVAVDAGSLMVARFIRQYQPQETSGEPTAVVAGRRKRDPAGVFGGKRKGGFTCTVKNTFKEIAAARKRSTKAKYRSLQTRCTWVHSTHGKAAETRSAWSPPPSSPSRTRSAIAPSIGSSAGPHRKCDVLDPVKLHGDGGATRDVREVSARRESACDLIWDAAIGTLRTS